MAKFFRLWILMAAGDTRVADLVDSTVHHEMDSTVRSHRFCKSVYSPVIEQLVLEEEPASQSTRWICSTWQWKWFSDSWPHSVKILHTDHMVLYYTKELCRPLSGVCHIPGRRRKGKGLVEPFRCNYYCGPTKDPALIRDPAFIFVIMLFSPATKPDQMFIQDRL